MSPAVLNPSHQTRRSTWMFLKKAAIILRQSSVTTMRGPTPSSLAAVAHRARRSPRSPRWGRRPRTAPVTSSGSGSRRRAQIWPQDIGSSRRRCQGVVGAMASASGGVVEGVAAMGMYGGAPAGGDGEEVVARWVALVAWPWPCR